MQEENIKSLWQSIIAQGNNIEINNEALFTSLENTLREADKNIKKRNLMEIAAAIFVSILFGAVAVYHKVLLVKIGAGLIIPAAMFVVYKLLKTRSVNKPTSSDMSTLVYLENTRNYYLVEKKLLEDIIWWYLLPLYIPLILFTIGMGGTIKIIVFTACMTLVYYWIFRLNKTAAIKYFQPLIEKLNQAIESLQKVE